MCSPTTAPRNQPSDFKCSVRQTHSSSVICTAFLHTHVVLLSSHVSAIVHYLLRSEEHRILSSGMSVFDPSASSAPSRLERGEGARYRDSQIGLLRNLFLPLGLPPLPIARLRSLPSICFGVAVQLPLCVAQPGSDCIRLTSPVPLSSISSPSGPGPDSSRAAGWLCNPVRIPLQMTNGELILVR